MNDLPLQIQRSIRRYKEINACGLTLYPVRVAEWDTFQYARLALEAMQQSFPVRLMSVPILQAMYQLDYEAASKGEPVTGLFTSALLGLALALRLGEGLEMDARLKQFQIRVDPKDKAKLKSIFALINGEEMIEITPTQYAKLRPIIAAQNGVKLESDDANPDLVKAERDIAEISNIKLNVSVEQMISSVCAFTGANEEDVDDWPILKLQSRADSLQRGFDYLVCGIGGAMGGFGKGGNPVPHPFYERAEKASVHMALGDFANGAGERAVANAGQQVS